MDRNQEGAAPKGNGTSPRDFSKGYVLAAQNVTLSSQAFVQSRSDSGGNVVHVRNTNPTQEVGYDLLPADLFNHVTTAEEASMRPEQRNRVHQNRVQTLFN